MKGFLSLAGFFLCTSVAVSQPSSDWSVNAQVKVVPYMTCKAVGITTFEFNRGQRVWSGRVYGNRNGGEFSLEREGGRLHLVQNGTMKTSCKEPGEDGNGMYLVCEGTLFERFILNLDNSRYIYTSNYGYVNPNLYDFDTRSPGEEGTFSPLNEIGVCTRV